MASGDDIIIYKQTDVPGVKVNAELQVSARCPEAASVKTPAPYEVTGSFPESANPVYVHTFRQSSILCDDVPSQ